MKFNSSEYISNWNNKIAAWQKDYLAYYNNDVFALFLKKTRSEKYKMQPEFLIEPYIGDINNCSAVFINKNPGQPIINLQHWKKGEFLTKDKPPTNAKPTNNPLENKKTNKPGADKPKGSYGDPKSNAKPGVVSKVLEKVKRLRYLGIVTPTLP